MLRRLACAAAPALRPAHFCLAHQVIKPAASDRTTENGQ